MEPSKGAILVAIDFSHYAELALAHAADLARRLGSRLLLAHSHQPMVVALPQGALAPPGEDFSPGEFERGLRELAVRVVGDTAPFEVHVRVGSAVDGLLSLIEELRPDLVVVGSHGKGAVMRLLIGSVAESLCRRSPVPVLVVPAPERIEAARREGEEAR